MKTGYVGNLEGRAEENVDFRRVVYTGPNMQLVLMALEPGGEIGDEVHETTDQFFRIEGGTGEVWIDGQSTHIESGSGILVPAGARHNVKNTGVTPMKMYTLYAPPHHADGTVQPTKAIADVAEEHFSGTTTE
jgi:mannose-6-phosphate isomerase-like protein (cupin superfamily)